MPPRRVDSASSWPTSHPSRLNVERYARFVAIADLAKPWLLEYREAYMNWVMRARPSADEELWMNGWLDRCCSEPPVAVDELATNKEAEGPSGEKITYRQFDALELDEVAGYIYILAIESTHGIG
jgi:hypothetical protein